MARQVLFKVEVAILATLQVVNACVWIYALCSQFAHAQQAAAMVDSPEAALNDPNIVLDFMATLPPSDDRKTKVGQTQTADQWIYYDLRQWVTAHRFYSNHKRSRKQMVALVVSFKPAFESECAAKGGHIEQGESEYVRRTLMRLNLNYKHSLTSEHLALCMRSPQQSLGGLAVVTFRRGNGDSAGDLGVAAINSLFKEPAYTTVVTLHPSAIITQTDLDKEEAARKAQEQRRSDEAAAELAEVERWRKTIRAGTETGCGPVLSVKRDMVEVVYYQTREPKWYRRGELWPGRFTKGGLQTSIRDGQARDLPHRRSALSRAFAVTMSLRMTAVMATLAGFPSAISWAYLALRFGLKRAATRAGM